MDYLVIFCLFVLGLIIGSFLNVVILRWNTGLKISRGRSKCFSCDKTLSWYELVPVFSFLFQKGKCRECESKISWQYPIVELVTGIALPAVFVLYGNYVSFFLLLSILVCFYIVMFVYDLRHKIIPDFFSYGAALIALFIIFLEWRLFNYIDLDKIVAGPILFLFFYFFWFVSRGRWMGLGDAKLALSIGWVLGLSHGIAAILLAFWIGAITALITMFIQKLFHKRGLGMKSEIPFGPFILIGFALAFFFQIDIQSILSYLAV